MPKAWSFARVSTAHQAETGGGLQRQADQGPAARWCQRNGYELVEHFSFAGSAWKGRHLAEGAPLRSWLEQAVAGELGPEPALLVEEVDRFTRQAGHVALGPLLSQVFPAGVRIVNLREGVVYSEEEFNRDDRLLADLLDDIRAAHRYSARLSRRLTGYWDQVRERIRRGEVVRPDSIAPFWIGVQGGQWVLNDRAPLARRIFARALEVGAVSIARELNAEGVPPPARRGDPSRPWSSGALVRHLQNPAAYGTVQLLRGQIHRDGYFPPLISREQWDHVQAAIQDRRQNMASRGRRDVMRWIGQGLTCCACGCRTRVMASGTGKRHRYLQCERRRDQVGQCQAITYRLDLLTAHLLTRLQPAQLAQLVGAGDEQREAAVRRREHAAQAVAAADRALANAEAALGEAILDGRSVEVFVKVHGQAAAAATTARGELAQAAAAVEALLGQAGTQDLHADVAALLRAFSAGEDTPEQRRAVNSGLRRLGVRITVAADRPALGLAVGDGQVDWQPVTWAQAEYLEQGRAGIRSIDLGDAVATVDGEMAAVHWYPEPGDPELPDG